MCRTHAFDASALFNGGKLRRLVDNVRRSMVIGLLAHALCGCMGTGDVSLPLLGDASQLPTDQTALRGYADTWGKRFDGNPGDTTTSLNYARALRALGRFNEALAVLQSASIKHPGNPVLAGAYGKVLADVGRFPEAAEVLGRAHTPERPDWSILSAQGTVADQMGNFSEAQGYYASALKIVPGEPTVLSNLGLSYALARRLTDGEATLRQAVESPKADTRVRHNLALVLALQGKFDEAVSVLQHDLAPADARADVASIRQMIAQSDTWRDIRRAGGEPRQGAHRIQRGTGDTLADGSH